MSKAEGYLDKPMLAAESHLSVREWERRIANGDIAVIRIGRRVLVKRSDFEAFMEARRVAPARKDVRSRLEQLAKRALAGRGAS